MDQSCKVRVVLSCDDFRRLVAGDTVRPAANAAVEIRLADIGWSEMLTAIEDAMNADTL